METNDNEEDILDSMEALFEEVDSVSKTYEDSIQQEPVFQTELDLHGVINSDCDRRTDEVDGIATVISCAVDDDKRVIVKELNEANCINKKVAQVKAFKIKDDCIDTEGKVLVTNSTDTGDISRDILTPNVTLVKSDSTNVSASRESLETLSSTGFNSSSQTQSRQSNGSPSGLNSDIGKISTISDDESASFRKRDWQLESKPRSNTCSYSSFIGSTIDECDCETTVIENKQEIEDTKMSYLHNIGDKDVVKQFIKKRKRNTSVSDNENTPKRKNVLFNPLYSSNDKLLSPITKGNEKSDKMRNLFVTTEKTPTILFKFNHWEQDGSIVNSTPILHSEKDKLKAKKSILKFDRIKVDPDTSASDFSGFSTNTTDSEDVDELISEITAICDEGLNREHNFSLASEHDEQHISKIDINELISQIDSEFDSTLVEIKDTNMNLTTKNGNNTVISIPDLNKENITISEQTCNDKMKSSIDKEVDKNTLTGRFKNVEATVSKLEFSDTEQESEEDILGLDVFDSDGFLDEEAIATLSRTGLVKDIPEDILEDNDGADGENEGKNDMAVFKLDKMDERKINIVESCPELQKMVNKVKDDIVEINIEVKPAVKVETDLKTKKLIELEKGKDKQQSEMQDKKITADFDTSLYRMDDKSEAMRTARMRWKSTGVPDPEINLTVATTFRKKSMSSGRVSPVGALEGERLCCVEMYEEEMKAYSGLKYSTLDQTLERLYNQQTMLERMRHNTVWHLRMEMDSDINTMKARHGKEIRQLNYRQDHEVMQMRRRQDMMPMVLQNSIMQLNQEHRIQRDRMQAHHQAVYHHLCQDWHNKLSCQTELYKERAVTLEEQICQIQNSQNIDNDTGHHYGPPVVVSLRKAPGKDTKGKQTTVTMCLSARIAQAVSLEDDIYDHFYTYK